MNILISINKDYIEPCKTMLFSLFKHNKIEINVYILNKNLTEEQLLELNSYIENMGGKCYVLSVNVEMFSNMPIKEFSIEMYYRIIAYKLVPQEIDRLLWLDSDIIVCGNIEKFYMQDFEDKSLVVSRDYYSRTPDIYEIKRRMEIDSAHEYFNSGVLLFNLNLIKRKMTDKLINNCLIKYSDKLKYPDQDILNHLYQNDVKYAKGREFNFQVNEISNCKIDSIKILHYSGYRKPWNARKASPISRYYWKCRFEMRDYIGFLKFYLLYTIFYVPKKIKKFLRKYSCSYKN